MATVIIPLRPETDRGREILDTFEKRFGIDPDHVEPADGTRRYRVDEDDADVDALDGRLDRVAADWRSHVTTWRD